MYHSSSNAYHESFITIAIIITMTMTITITSYLLTHSLTYLLIDRATVTGSVGGCSMDMWCPYGAGREFWDRIFVS